MSRHIETCLDTLRHCVDTSTHCVHTSRHCLDTFMIALENGLDRKKIMYILHIILESHVLLSCVMCVWNWNQNSRVQTYRYVINSLHLYVTSYYMFVCTVSLLVLTICLILSMHLLKYIYIICIFGEICTNLMGPTLVICTVMWGLYVDYSSSDMGHIHTVWQAYLFRLYANNVKCVYTSIPGHIVDCSEFIWGHRLLT